MFSLQIRIHFEIVVTGYREAAISIPAIEDGDPLDGKELLSPGEVSSAGKYTLEEHLASLGRNKKITPHRPLLVLGLRNVLVNPRGIAIVDGSVYAVAGEKPEKSARPYFGIGFRDGRFFAESILGPGAHSTRGSFFFTGIPVLWDETTGGDLLNLILTETADQTHVYDLPRGKHPAADEASSAAINTLQGVFLAHLESEFCVAVRAMRDAIGSLPRSPERCDTYLHSILGVDGEGHLVNIIGHGRLEELGESAARLGCRRAICVENSGSIMPTLLKNGVAEDGRIGEIVPLLRAPNFRTRGRTLLVIELESSAFKTLSPRDPICVHHGS